MNASDILALSKAGYNSQQIAIIDREMRLEAAQQKPVEQPKPAEDPKPAEVPKPEPEQKPAEQPKPEPEQPKPEPEQVDMTPIMEQLNKLTTAIYASNINGTNQPADMTAESIIAQIIRPNE